MSDKEESGAYRLACFYRRKLLTVQAEILHYKWSESFKINCLIATNEVYTDMEDGSEKWVNIEELSVSEMKDLGFGLWSEDTNLYLIPLWLLSFIKKDLSVTDIDGKSKLLVNAEKDTDHRFGCLSYGIVPSELLKHTQENQNA